MAEGVAQLEKQLESERKELAYARLKIQVLEEQLRQQRIAQYGPGSEKLSNLQLELLDEEPAVNRDEVQAESEREPGAPPPATSGNKQRVPHPGRQSLPAPAASSRPLNTSAVPPSSGAMFRSAVPWSSWRPIVFTSRLLPGNWFRSAGLARLLSGRRPELGFGRRFPHIYPGVTRRVLRVRRGSRRETAKCNDESGIISADRRSVLRQPGVEALPKLGQIVPPEPIVEADGSAKVGGVVR